MIGSSNDDNLQHHEDNISYNEDQIIEKGGQHLAREIQ